MPCRQRRSVLFQFRDAGTLSLIRCPAWAGHDRRERDAWCRLRCRV